MAGHDAPPPTISGGDASWFGIGCSVNNRLLKLRRGASWLGQRPTLYFRPRASVIVTPAMRSSGQGLRDVPSAGGAGFLGGSVLAWRCPQVPPSLGGISKPAPWRISLRSSFVGAAGDTPPPFKPYPLPSALTLSPPPLLLSAVSARGSAGGGIRRSLLPPSAVPPAGLFVGYRWRVRCHAAAAVGARCPTTVGYRWRSLRAGPQLPAPRFHYSCCGLLAPLWGAPLVPRGLPVAGPPSPLLGARGSPAPSSRSPLPAVGPRRGRRGYRRAVVGRACVLLPCGRSPQALPPLFCLLRRLAPFLGVARRLRPHCRKSKRFK